MEASLKPQSSATSSGSAFLVAAAISAIALCSLLLVLSQWKLDLSHQLFVDGNYFVSVVFFLLMISVFMRGYRGRQWDPLSPQRLFFTVWFFLLGLGNLRLSGVEQPFSLRVWLMILSALGSFYLGGLIARRKGESQWLPLSELLEKCKPNWDFSRAVALLIGLFCVSTLAMGYSLYRFGAIPLFSNDVEYARNNFGVNSYIQRLAISFYVVIPLCYIVLAHFKRWKFLFLVMAGCSLLVFVLTATSYFVLNSLTIVAVLYRYWNKRIPVRGLIVLFLVLLTLKITVDRFRFYKTSYFADIANRTGYPEFLVAVAPQYFYLAMNLQTFQQLTEMIPSSRGYSYGWYIAYPIRTFWTPRIGEEYGRDRLVDSLWDQSIKWFGFSSVTVSYLGDPYADFGWVGVAIYSFVFGWFSTFWYGRLRREPTFWRLFVYAQIVQAIFYSFMAAYFDLFDIYWYLLVVGALHYLVRVEVAPQGADGGVPLLANA